jgi:hypothetical protein
MIVGFLPNVITPLTPSSIPLNQFSLGIIGQIPVTDILFVLSLASSLSQNLTFSNRITHGPPYGILDKVISGQPVGCETLRARLDSGSLRPRLHLFGHIHEAHGALIKSAPEREGQPAFNTAYVNAAAWPMGAKTRGPGGARLSMPFGEGVFAPVVVDLLDTVV